MKSRELDQFYTNKEIAKKIYNMIEDKFELNNYFLVEPSAGDGSFSSLFHKDSVAFDIDPKSENIIAQDFLQLEAKFNTKKPIITIGNPPFGKNSSLALRFLNKSAKFSSYIVFILPKTFKKESIVNKIDAYLHCIYEEDLNKNAFIFNGEIYDVPCVIQIWKKTDKKRVKTKLKTESDYFNFVTKKEADFAIRRVGGLAGKLLKNFENYKAPSHYYIKIKNDNCKNKIIEAFEMGFNDLQEVAKNTAGNPSLSKGELIKIIEDKIKK